MAAAFRRARDAVYADPALDEATRRRALEEVLARGLTEPERRRVRALELAPE